MAAPVTKGSWMVTDPRRIPQMVAHALKTAYGGRRGPVHLTIPIDVQDQAVDEDEVVFHQRTDPDAAASLATPALIEDAISLLRAASRPLIIAGTAASYSGSGDALAEFVETTRIPVMTEGDARGLLPDDHPHCLGFYDPGLNGAAQLASQADLVLLLGRKQDFVVGYAMPPRHRARREGRPGGPLGGGDRPQPRSRRGHNRQRGRRAATVDRSGQRPRMARPRLVRRAAIRARALDRRRHVRTPSRSPPCTPRGSSRP